jgi:excisionase family DNA binding protein
MSPEATRAIYARMPDRLARKLDRAAERLGASKRDVLAALVNDHLDVDGDNFVIALGSSRAAPAAGPEPGGPGPAGEVLTLEETAELLRVEPGEVLALIEAGELPARLLGRQWRLSRTAVLAWLGGDGPPGQRARGERRSR